MGTNRCHYDEGDYKMVAKMKKHPRKRIGMVAGCILLIGALLALAFALNLTPIMIAMAEAKGRQLAVVAINEAVREVMGGGVIYSDLMQVTKDISGRVSMIQANTLLMNDLASKAALVAQRNLRSLGDEGVELPLGSALGIGILSGAGPRIRASVVPVGSVTTRFVTAFESAGINQTRHEISLLTSTLVHIVIPTGANAVQVEALVPIAESIIVGEVPDTYMNAQDAEQALDLAP